MVAGETGGGWGSMVRTGKWQWWRRRIAHLFVSCGNSPRGGGLLRGKDVFLVLGEEAVLLQLVLRVSVRKAGDVVTLPGCRLHTSDASDGLPRFALTR